MALENQQVAQLSQRDCAAGWVSYGQKWKTWTRRQNYWHHRSILNHCDVFSQQSNQIRWKTHKKAITPFKVIQGHRGRYQSKARMQLSIGDWIVTDNLPRTVAELSQLIVQIFDTLCFWATLWCLGTTYDVHLGLIGKRVVDFLLVIIALFSLGVTAERLRAKNRSKIGDFASTWSVWPKISGRRGRRHQ